MLFRSLQKHLDHYGLEPQQIMLELTETALLGEGSGLSGQLHQLGQAGFRLSLDDFGTGYSSLALLREYRVAQVKIDKSFVADLLSNAENRVIIRGLAAMADGLELDLLAEGVETAAQWQQLRELGLTGFQGYYFAKPLAAEAFTQLLRQPAASLAPA